MLPGRGLRYSWAMRPLILPMLVTAICSCSDTSQSVPDQTSVTTTTKVTATVDNSKTRPKFKRTHLPQRARSLLKKEMWLHGDTMESVFWSTLMLDYETIRLLTASMGDGQRIARPIDDRSANAWFPQQFFDLQDQMFSLIGQLNKEAVAKNSAGIAQAYANLAKTCVNCHAVFLRISDKTE